jgi:pimeloyl-ACP methyl ester carboxylesterase
MIAPWRPGFAGSTAAGAAFDSVPDIVTADLHQVLRHFGLRRVPFVGRDAGIIYAAAAAAAPGDAASAVVAVSGMVPTRDRRQLDHIALWQRMFAYAARYFPAALPILARGAMELVSTGKLDRLLDGLYQTPAIDHRLVAVPEIRDILRESFVSTFAHGTRACEVDARRTALDWTALALSGLRVPLVYVHGALDPVSVPRQVDDLAHRTPGMSIETIADGGQLIWYSHPRTIFEVIARHAGQQDQT